jgi:hypothetical protein
MKPKELLLLDETTIVITIEIKVYYCFKNSLPTSLKVFSPLSLNSNLSLLLFLFFSSHSFVFSFFLFLSLFFLLFLFQFFSFFLLFFLGVVGLRVLIEGLKCSRVPLIWLDDTLEHREQIPTFGLSPNYPSIKIEASKVAGITCISCVVG